MPDAGGLAYSDVFAGSEAGKAGGIAGGAAGLLSRPGIKGAGAGIFVTWLLNKLLQTHHETSMRGIQKEALASQAEMVTPETLYYQAAQPGAQQEETQARTALMSQLTGGVLGPALAKGEYQIGQ